MVDILPGGSRLEASSPEQTQGARTRLAPAEAKAGTAEGRRRTYPGRVHPSSSRLPELLGREGTKRRPNRVRAFVEYPKTGTTRNAGPVPYRAAGSLSSVDGKAHTRERGKPSVAGTLRVLPTHATDICLQRPSVPTARRLNKQT